MSDQQPDLQAIAAKLGIGAYRRHVFLCTGPDCCSPETGQAAWDTLKKSLKDAGLASGPNACYRTKVGCLRICRSGPIMLVYPDGIWYHSMTPDRIPLVVTNHLVQNNPVEDLVFARNPLE